MSTADFTLMELLRNIGNENLIKSSDIEKENQESSMISKLFEEDLTTNDIDN